MKMSFRRHIKVMKAAKA